MYGSRNAAYLHTLLCAAGSTHATLQAAWVRSAGIELARGEHPRGMLRAGRRQAAPLVLAGEQTLTAALDR